MKKLTLIIAPFFLFAMQVNANYVAVSLNSKYDIKSDVPEPPTETITVEEGYPFSSLVLSTGFISDGSRHYTATVSSNAKFTVPEDTTSLTFSIPTEAGPSGNKRMDIELLSESGTLLDTCIIPYGGYELHLCEFEVNDVNAGETFTFKGNGFGGYFIIGNYTIDNEIFKFEYKK